jgi:uncharacterized pyridoxamine 5'-phosphate oxidase family protein
MRNGRNSGHKTEGWTHLFVRGASQVKELKMTNSSRNWVIAMFLLAGLAGADGAGRVLAAEKAGNADKKREADNKQAAAEAEKEERLEMEDQLKIKSQFNGVLTVQSDLEDGNPAVVGALSCSDDSKIYLLKVDNKDTLKILQSNDKQKVTISGRLRNDGKYLVVTGIIEHRPGPVRVSRRTLGGL